MFRPMLICDMEPAGVRSRLILMMIAIVALHPPGKATASAPQPPNLLIVHTDEHNFRTLGCYRALMRPEQAFVWGPGVQVETPHIDSLAASGALCDRFYAASPVCTPSRASFVSGLFPQNTGAHINDVPMRDDVVTFAEVLRRHGYATGYAGKWHLDGDAKPGWAPARKFGFDDNRYMFNRGHWKQLEDTPQGPRVKPVRGGGQETYGVSGADARSFTTDFLADRAVEFIRAHRGTPFCFMLSLPDPHGPNTVRPPYDTMFAKFDFQRPRSASAPGEALPPCAASWPDGKLENMARYFGMVKCIDDNVGKILKSLREMQIADRTIIVFTADHGDMCGEHGRVNKGIPLEASARIPFIISYPGKIKPGTVIHEALATVDFKPTILGLMGVPGEGPTEGRNASALLLTGRPPADWSNVAISRHTAGQWLMAVSSRHKLIVSRDGDPCLFDLDADPLELRNVFRLPENRQVVRQLGRALLDYCRKVGAPPAEHPAVQADLNWCAHGDRDYRPPARQREAVKKDRTRRAKTKARGTGRPIRSTRA